MKQFTTTDNRNIMRVSRWISIKHNYNPNKRNNLWYYVTDGNGYREGQAGYDKTAGLYLDYFIFQGRKYAINQFLNLNNPFYCIPVMFYENGKLQYLSGYDSENYYNPIMIELSEDGEQVRIYQ